MKEKEVGRDHVNSAKTKQNKIWGLKVRGRGEQQPNELKRWRKFGNAVE